MNDSTVEINGARVSPDDPTLEPYRRLIVALAPVWSVERGTPEQLVAAASDLPEHLEDVVRALCDLVVPLVPPKVRETLTYPGRGASVEQLEWWARTLENCAALIEQVALLPEDVKAPDRIALQRARPIVAGWALRAAEIGLDLGAHERVVALARAHPVRFEAYALAADFLARAMGHVGVLIAGFDADLRTMKAARGRRLERDQRLALAEQIRQARPELKTLCAIAKAVTQAEGLPPVYAESVERSLRRAARDQKRERPD